VDDHGSATIQISAPGYLTGSATVTLVPTGFYPTQSSVTLTLPNTGTVQLLPAPATAQASYAYTNYHFRAGTTPFAIGAASGNTGIVTVSPAQATVGPGSGEIDFKLQSVGGGSTSLSIAVSDPYLAPPSLTVTVQGGQLSLYGVSAVGKNLQAALSINTQSGVGVTVTSSDPSRLVVSASAAAQGQASATVTQGVVYVQALSDSGTVAVTASAPGYQTATAQIAVTPAAATFAAASIGTLTTLSPPVALQVQLVSYTANGSSYYSPQQLRGGAPALTVPVNLSDATVGTVTPAQLVFNSGDSVKSFTFQPTGAGSELISLGVPSGFADAFSAREELLAVIAPRLAIAGATTIGKDLQSTLTATLSSAPAQAVAVTLNSADATRVELGPSTGSLGASVNLNFGANSTAGAQFRIAGLDSSGTVALNLAAPGLTASNYSVTLEPSGFRFGSTSATLASGATSFIQVISCALLPGSLAPAGDYAVRSDIAAPVPLTIASSNSSVVAVPPGPLYFDGGTAQQTFSITAGSPGIAILTLTPPSGWSKPSGGFTMTITVH
jgi:hypothetical protein